MKKILKILKKPKKPVVNPEKEALRHFLKCCASAGQIKRLK